MSLLNVHVLFVPSGVYKFLRVSVISTREHNAFGFIDHRSWCTYFNNWWNYNKTDISRNNQISKITHIARLDLDVYGLVLPVLLSSLHFQRNNEKFGRSPNVWRRNENYFWL